MVGANTSTIEYGPGSARGLPATPPLADDRAKHRGPAQSADGHGPAVSHPAGVVERGMHSGELLDVAFQRVVRPRGQVVLVEPGPQVRPELVDLHAGGLPTACGRPEACAPLRRIN